MNLNVLNETGTVNWLDDVWKATKGILKNYFEKSSLENFIRKGFVEQEFKALEKAILDSPNGKLGVDLKNSLIKVKDGLPPTATAEKLVIQTRINEIDNVILNSVKGLKYGEFVTELSNKLASFTEKNRWTIAKDKDLLTKVDGMKKVIAKLETNEGKQFYEQMSGKDVDEFIQLAKNRFPNTFQNICGKYSRLPKFAKYSVIAFIIFATVSCSKQKNCKALYKVLGKAGSTIKNLFGGAMDFIFDDNGGGSDNGGGGGGADKI
jgi:hypothetical protein